MGHKCQSCGFDNILGEDRCKQCFHSLMQRDLPRPTKDDKIQNIFMTSPISDLVTGRDLLVASPSDTIDKIVKIFQKEEKECVLVYKRKKLVGILSKRDLLQKVAGTVDDLSQINVETVMTKNPEYVKSDAPIAFVVNKMAVGGFRHVPVLDADGTPLSIVRIKDVLAFLSLAEKSISK